MAIIRNKKVGQRWCVVATRDGELRGVCVWTSEDYQQAVRLRRWQEGQSPYTQWQVVRVATMIKMAGDVTDYYGNLERAITSLSTYPQYAIININRYNNIIGDQDVK